MNKIKYLDDDFHSREGLIRHYFFVYQGCSFNDYIADRKYDLHFERDYCPENNLEAGYNDYLILKQEIEEMLTRRDPLEVGKVILESNDYGTINTLEDIKKHYADECNVKVVLLEKLERIYYEFYHEDENFRLDLIETPIKELKAIPFG